MATDTLAGETALVTGASSGIGEATAHALADAGAAVALAARREERLEDIAETLRAEHDTGALVVPTDVTDVAAVEAMVETTADEFGGGDGEAFEDRFEPGEVSDPEEVAAAVRFGAEQDPSMVSELDLYRRDKLTFF